MVQNTICLFRIDTDKSDLQLLQLITADEFTGGIHSYQEDLVTPGISPFVASSRKQMRQTPKRRM